MTENVRDQLAAARHAAATGWCQDDTTMPQVEAFGAGWDAALAAVLPVVERLVAEQAAGELDAVAEELLGFGDTAPSKTNVHLAAWLQATADNLRVASSREPLS